MAKVLIIQQVFNSRKWVELVYPAMVNQTYKDVEIVAQIVHDDGGCEEYIRTNFPQIKILKPGYNIGFARGHNEIFGSTNAEYYQLVNPDLILEPNYIEEMVKAFDANPNLGAATGKLLQYNFERKEKTNIFDTTGVVVSQNGRARDRGQHEKDSGQYDNQTNILAVSGAGPMYRKSALEAVKMPRFTGNLSAPLGHLSSRGENDHEVAFEYFDEDFNSYWEDVDLSLRLQNAGFASLFVPGAVAYHGRTAGSSEKGYKDVAAYKKHHDALPVRIKQLNYKNHQFLVYKNFPKVYWKYFVREFFMLGYIIFFEIRTLGVVSELFKQLPLILQKRKWIRQHRKNLEWVKLLNNKGLLS